MAIWVIKCRQTKSDGQEGWHWRHYFRRGVRAFNQISDWGGREWIRSPQSCKHLREDAGKGDLVVCYQYEGRQIMGLTQMAKDPTEEGGVFNTIWLAARGDSFSLMDVQPSLNVMRLRNRGCDPQCFVKNTQGTVFPVDADEFGGIISAIDDDYPHLRVRLNCWLKKAGYEAH